MPMGREKAIKRQLVTFQRDLAARQVNCANLRWECTEMVWRRQGPKVDVNKALKVVSTSLVADYAQMYSAVQGESDNTY